eukprot:TRINITY_DN62280_c0_g1_i1.p1 TRINITY_DN62280_c0_g1~~TRINITY_DN62280_c0_g1_i1.p1  ORF type:complete len:876 (-),score=193.68 TRINITY_DN62280_c0_g1_i1:167-2794(-)
MAAVAPADVPQEPKTEDKCSPPDVAAPPKRRSLRGPPKGLDKLKENNSFMGVLNRLSHALRPLQDSMWFRGLLVSCLIFALFGGGLFVVCNVPDDPGIAWLDVLMSIVTVLFVLEMALNGIVDYHSYPLSFFFWMDALGTVSMVFEISTLLGTHGKMQTASGSVDAMLMRTARAAKVGARVGRLSKLTKCISYYFKDKGGEVDASKPAEAKVLSQKLMLTLSTKVSLLTILLVLVVPLFSIGQYPEEDLSMRLWARRLESDYQLAYESIVASSAQNTLFEETVEEMKEFYSTINYGIFDVLGYPEEVTVSEVTYSIPGSALLDEIPEPAQKANVYRIQVPECLLERAECQPGTPAYLYFNFQGPKQIEAAEDMAMVFFIILVMILVSVKLSHTLDMMVVQPMERMLGMVKSMASDILKQFGFDEDMEHNQEDEDTLEETELIEGIFKKFARLASLAAGRNEATEAELAGMDEAAKGVMMEMMNVQVARDEHKPEGEEDEGSDNGSVNQAEVPAVSALPLPRSTIDSWELDVLSLDVEGQTKIALYVFFDSAASKSTGRCWTEVDTFHRFHSVVKSGYNDLPYHNYAHACDVLHTVYRLLCLTSCHKWLSSVDQYALMVAALCHDVGHAGKTNPFLVEIGDELALRYNDKSPLENMHCAKLFSICSQEETDVFKQMDKETKKQARRVCIAAILHTDNVNHFEMVREISKIYEMASDICDTQARLGDDFSQHYLEQVLQKNSIQWLELFLHFADVSNPLKPFNVCLKWAWRVLDEFFDQGDEEKRLGIPVGMLNDREKINRPGSQHGFINFLVAPLVAGTVKLFPVLHPVYTQMASNLGQWKEIWIEEAKPSEEEIAKKDADVQKHKDQALELEQRC